ncbi:hypothetical protein FRC03_012475 [Tulasnella sp. 419]|nr:hypothetical protein FRC03_012475 [Tulasnella sp. 419]
MANPTSLLIKHSFATTSLSYDSNATTHQETSLFQMSVDAALSARNKRQCGPLVIQSAEVSENVSLVEGTSVRDSYFRALDSVSEHFNMEKYQPLSGSYAGKGIQALKDFLASHDLGIIPDQSEVSESLDNDSYDSSSTQSPPNDEAKPIIHDSLPEDAIASLPTSTRVEHKMLTTKERLAQYGIKCPPEWSPEFEPKVFLMGDVDVLYSLKELEEDGNDEDYWSELESECGDLMEEEYISHFDVFGQQILSFSDLFYDGSAYSQPGISHAPNVSPTSAAPGERLALQEVTSIHDRHHNPGGSQKHGSSCLLSRLFRTPKLPFKHTSSMLATTTSGPQEKRSEVWHRPWKSVKREPSQTLGLFNSGGLVSSACMEDAFGVKSSGDKNWSKTKRFCERARSIFCG